MSVIMRRQWSQKPNFHNHSVFAEKLIAVKLRKLKVKFHKPIHVGMCIFDISKVCLLVWISSRLYVTDDESRQMQNYVHRHSFIYRVECDNVYETMKRDVARFDTNDPIQHTNIESISHKHWFAILRILQ